MIIMPQIRLRHSSKQSSPLGPQTLLAEGYLAYLPAGIVSCDDRSTEPDILIARPYCLPAISHAEQKAGASSFG
jgi:hypothetical protein